MCCEMEESDVIKWYVGAVGFLSLTEEMPKPMQISSTQSISPKSFFIFIYLSFEEFSSNSLPLLESIQSARDAG